MRAVWTVAILAMGWMACGDEGTDTPAAQDVPYELRFEGLVDGEAFSCGGTYNLGTAGTPSQFTDFKLYVSSLELLKADGTAVPLVLDNDGKWQDGRVALLDFEDATGACLNGNADVNASVKGKAPEGDYNGVRFVLGVPFERNHADAAAAGAPLNLTSMFWSWQSGYKFLRVDGKADNGGFRVHLGSTACTMGANDLVESCGNPNRPTVTLDAFDPATDKVAVDIGQLFTELDMTPNMDGNSAVCMSDPMHSPCNSVFPALGLGFGSTPAAAQRVFAKK